MNFSSLTDTNGVGGVSAIAAISATKPGFLPVTMISEEVDSVQNEGFTGSAL